MVTRKQLIAISWWIYLVMGFAAILRGAHTTALTCVILCNMLWLASGKNSE